jgi:hypothetical protein
VRASEAVPEGTGTSASSSSSSSSSFQQQQQQQQRQRGGQQGSGTGSALGDIDELGDIMSGMGLGGRASSGDDDDDDDDDSSSSSSGGETASDDPGDARPHGGRPPPPASRSSGAADADGAPAARVAVVGALSVISSSDGEGGWSGAAPGGEWGGSRARRAEEAVDDLVLPGGFCLAGRVAAKLYAHQVEGVRWLWSLHAARKGGILADDMGLGKTMQCSAFVAGALQSDAARRAVVVAPKTLLAHWEKELAVCGLRGRTFRFFGSNEAERQAALRAVTSARGGVLLTTYGMVLHNAEALAKGLGKMADGGFGGVGSGEGGR